MSRPPGGPPAATAPPPSDDVLLWPGAAVLAPSGGPLGHVDHVYVDRATGRPTFVAVAVGGPGCGLPLLPVERLALDGRGLTADVTSLDLAGAPAAAASGALRPGEEDDVRGYYRGL